MQFFKNTYILNLLTFVSLSIIVLSLINKSVYTHSHISETGEIVIHAHPFNLDDEAPIKKHEHTSLEYLVLNIFNFFTLGEFSFTLLIFFFIIARNYDLLNPIVKQLFFHYKKNKSPPFIYSY